MYLKLIYFIKYEYKYFKKFIQKVCIGFKLIYLSNCFKTFILKQKS